VRLNVKSSSGLKLPPGKTDHVEFDDDIAGFGIRLREGGSRTYVFQYRIGAKQRRIALGAVGAIDFGKARSTAKDLYAKVRLGQDPAGEKVATRAKATHLFKTLADDFLDHQRSRLRAESVPTVARYLLVHAKALHGLRVEKVTRADIAAVLGTTERASGEVSRNRVRATLMTLFAWGMAEGRADTNPVIGTSRAKEKSRDRVLSPAELRVIWQNLPDNHFGAVMKLLALTGQRASEIADLRWSEIDDGTIKLPGKRTKNSRPHDIPLSAPAAEIIDAQPRREDRDLIFGIGELGFSGWSKARAQLNAAIKKAEGKALPYWTPHDLRRSFATHAAKIGIEPHIIEAVLNHVTGHKAGVAGIYNRANYAVQIRKALDQWGEYLMAVVEGRKSKVTPLRRKA
jgi:integrase